MKNKKMKITCILERDGITEKHGQWLGKQGYIQNQLFRVGGILMLSPEDEKVKGFLQTSQIEDIEQTVFGFNVITKYSIYVLAYVDEE